MATETQANRMQDREENIDDMITVIEEIKEAAVELPTTNELKRVGADPQLIEAMAVVRAARKSVNVALARLERLQQHTSNEANRLFAALEDEN